MSRVLLTGANGFAGPYVATALVEHGHQVIGTWRAQDGPTSSAISEWVEVDLVNLSATAAAVKAARADAVIHLAAISFVGHSDVSEMYASNVLGTRNLLESLAQTGMAGPVVVASSANVYGNRQTGRLVESLKPDPRSDYAMSKLVCEHLASMYSNRLSTVIVRPFNYTGVGQGKQFLIPKIISKVKSSEAEVYLGNIEVARDFSDVRFVAESLSRLLSCSEAIGKTINICSGHAVTITNVIDLISIISGVDIIVKIDPSLVRSQEVEKLWGSDALLQKLIGPINCPPLEVTLRWMLNNT